ncbi:MAG TPA: 50S ribosomal protein L13 [Candidatus Paceibacterota bacterium]|nr:large subunit ribosomal protein [Patescibacteria group bacterium]
MEHTIDATNKSLGRLASEIAMKLRGKDSPSFLPYVKPVNKVKIVNANQVKITGQKSAQKIYTRHSGHPGGLKSLTLEKLREKKGVSNIIEKAVYGMLPDNKLRPIMMKNLTIND